MPIISVDYSLGRRYPIAHQEVLDVYLWLVSGSQSVVRQLGFRPTKIVLTGDSAGGNLSLSLIMMVHDIKELNVTTDRVESEPTLLAPPAFVSIYSGFRSATATPSKVLMSMLDPILSPGVFLASTAALVASSEAIDERADMVSILSLIGCPSLQMPIFHKVSRFIAKLFKDLRILGKIALSGILHATCLTLLTLKHCVSCLNYLIAFLPLSFQAPAFSPVF